ncbi:hypothetical protein XENTR_v10020514 [Xenopus tropicalis]|nr:hypothetical protein XENTR_v10020514 [Xenopus tropicalis]
MFLGFKSCSLILLESSLCVLRVHSTKIGHQLLHLLTRKRRTASKISAQQTWPEPTQHNHIVMQLLMMVRGLPLE